MTQDQVDIPPHMVQMIWYAALMN